MTSYSQVLPVRTIIIYFTVKNVIKYKYIPYKDESTNRFKFLRQVLDFAVDKTNVEGIEFFFLILLLNNARNLHWGHYKQIENKDFSERLCN